MFHAHTPKNIPQSEGDVKYILESFIDLQNISHPSL